MFSTRAHKLTALSFTVALVLALWPPMARPTEAAVYTVNTVVDENDGSCSDGDCSLRDAIILANNNFGPDTIAFNISGCGGVCTIQPTSALPTLWGGGTTIDGYTQPGALQATDTTSATLLIEIDGTNAGNSNGFQMTSAANVIKGLVINRFSRSGVYISGGTGNTVSGNYIGTDATGTADLGNAWDGVSIGGGAQNNTVGGDTAAERNVISGNDMDGVRIFGSGTTGNTVCGNYIGTDASGTADLGNAFHGVSISGGAQNNTVGGDTAGERNVISGNDEDGVRIFGSGTTGNTVSGNYIGTDANGTADLGNADDGVDILSGAQNNIIGGDTATERNVISGNDADGVHISDSGTTGNTVSGNYIGTDASGTADLGNADDGVYISGGAQNNTIGGDTAAERNVISGNDDDGVHISDSGTTGNTVSGNYIGADASGTADLGNTGYGVRIAQGAQNNTVGPGNVIAHNSLDGVGVYGGSTISNTITQNSIFSNTMGIRLVDGANGNIAAPVIVTTTVGSVNVVGTACPGCTVEVFENGDTDGEGETYVGDTTANASGAFTLTVSSLSDPYLTATATDVVSGTSEFSAVFTATVPLAPSVGPLYLPIILRDF